jgi:hypothetical protein
MDSGTIERPIPFTHERAATELVLTRRHLEAARGSLTLAMRIVDTLHAGRSPERLASLERVLRRVEEAQAVLGDAAG